jgi:hypothetical protein
MIRDALDAWAGRRHGGELVGKVGGSQLNSLDEHWVPVLVKIGTQQHR